MNITDTVQFLADQIREGLNAAELIGAYVNTATYEVHTAILDELGDCDLSEPLPDLTVGWTRVREQLAYNALYRAVMADLAANPITADNITDEQIRQARDLAPDRFSAEACADALGLPPGPYDAPRTPEQMADERRFQRGVAAMLLNESLKER